MTDTTETAPTELQLLKQRAKLMGITFSNNITLDKLKAKINERMNAEAEEVDEDAPDADDSGNEDAEDTSEDAEELFEAPAATPAALDPIPAAAAPANSAPAVDVDALLAQVAALKSQLEAQNTATAAVGGASAGAAPAAPSKRLTRAELEQQVRNDLHMNEMKLLRCRITCMNPQKADLHGEILTVANEYLGIVRKFVPFGEATDEGFHIPKCLYDLLNERRFQNIRTIKDKRTGVPRVEASWAKEFAIEILPPLTADELSRLAIAQAAAGSISTDLD